MNGHSDSKQGSLSSAAMGRRSPDRPREPKTDAAVPLTAGDGWRSSPTRLRLATRRTGARATARTRQRPDIGQAARSDEPGVFFLTLNVVTLGAIVARLGMETASVRLIAESRKEGANENRVQSHVRKSFAITVGMSLSGAVSVAGGWRWLVFCTFYLRRRWQVPGRGFHNARVSRRAGNRSKLVSRLPGDAPRWAIRRVARGV